MLTNEEIDKIKSLFVTCKHCFYGNLKNTDVLVNRSKCSKCNMNDNSKKRITDALSSCLFEPSNEYERAVRQIIKEKKL